MFRVEDFLCLSWSVLVKFYHVFLRPLPCVCRLSFFLLTSVVRVVRTIESPSITKILNSHWGIPKKEALGVKSDVQNKMEVRNSNQYMRMQDAKEQGDLISVLKSADSNNLQRKSINLNSKTPNTTAFSLKPIRYLQ